VLHGTFQHVVRAAALTVVLALAAAPAAGAWTTLATGLSPTVTPSLIVTQAGTELAAFDSPTAGTISVSRSHGTPKVVVSGDPSANRAQLVQQPSGAIQLYFPNTQGVGRLTSTDDGISWTGPAQTQSHTTGPVESAAVLPDGTPLFSQNGTGFVNVFRGLNGEVVKNVYARCCGYHESLAVDSTGLAQIAFFSNADPSWATVFEPLATDLTPGTASTLKPVSEHEAPLVADRSGNTFLEWAPGYPTATGVSVVPFRVGSPAGDGVSVFRGSFRDNEHLGLAVDAQERVWALWTLDGSLFAARSRSHAMHFGATVHVALPETAHALVALGLTGTPGTVDVVVNTGSSLAQQSLEPGLSVRVFKKVKKVGAKKVATWWAQGLDDGFGVPGVTFSAPGCRVHGNASGIAKLTGAGFKPGSAKAAAPGYVSAAFRVP
jgi:hypothetical protein